MATIDIKLLSVKTSPNQKAVIVKQMNDQSLHIYYADNSSDELKLDLNNINVPNRASIITVSGDIIHALYRDDRVTVKSSNYSKPFEERNETAEDLINQYSPFQTKPSIGLEDDGQCLYSIVEPTTAGHVLLQDDLVNVVLTTDLSTFNTQISTYLFDTDKLSTDNPILSTINGINYNYMYEINGNSPQFYANTALVGQTFKLKNQLDTSYSMAMPTDSSIKNCRTYVGIGKCGGNVYLKYIDNADYSLCPISGKNNILSANMNDNGNTLQHIEVLDGINRHNVNSYPNSITTHKSNLFSIKINHDSFSKQDDSIRDKIKQEIKNNVREIVKKLTPASTLLFKVIVN